ncbi:uncharacterized protein [Temnothorax nylanderi]|uniref:uncharacterized protein n=1 Tax=Temnothorax nylanderi TaxID=102681 RepID=UPI003A88FB51
MYDRIRRVREELGVVPPRAKRAVKAEVRATVVDRWKEWLADPRRKWGKRVAQAVQPVLEEWVEGGKRRFVSFHTAQVVTGHGCFGSYLHRIGKERTTRCWHCPEEADTAQHTLEFCPAWEVECRALRAQIGEDLSLPTIIAAAV